MKNVNTGLGKGGHVHSRGRGCGCGHGRGLGPDFKIITNLWKMHGEPPKTTKHSVFIQPNIDKKIITKGLGKLLAIDFARNGSNLILTGRSLDDLVKSLENIRQNKQHQKTLRCFMCCF